MNLFLDKDINLITFYAPHKPIFSSVYDKFIYKIIKKNIKDNIPIVAGTSNLDYEAGVLGNHAYSVLAAKKMIDNKGDRKNYYILLSNPHGKDVTQYYYDYCNNTIRPEIREKGQYSGVMWVELNHFMDTFEVLSYHANKGSINNPANINEPLFYQTNAYGAHLIKLLSLRRDKNLIKTSFETEGLYNGFYKEKENCTLIYNYFKLISKKVNA